MRLLLRLIPVLLTPVLLTTVLVLAACTEQDRNPAWQKSTDTRMLELTRYDTRGGFARVQSARDFRFPQDHGSHPRYKHERWQFSGNLHATDGRQFAYQFTLRRIGLTAEPVSLRISKIVGKAAAFDTSHWRSRHLYLASLSLTDIDNNKFYQFEKTERGTLGLADVTLNEDTSSSQRGLAMSIDNWAVTSTSDTVFPLHLFIVQKDRDHQQDIVMDMVVDPDRDIQSIGRQGVRQQGKEAGNASYSYSITRLSTSGSIAIGKQVYATEGESWFDHEWGTAAMGHGIKGSDWFALQFSDGRELGFYHLRDQRGATNRWSRGIIVFDNDHHENIRYNDIEFQNTNAWTSQQTGITYPVSWKLRIPKYHLVLHVTPLIPDQEIIQGQNYWEGAVRVAGYQNAGAAKLQTINGYGYIRLAGYDSRDMTKN
jgi:predicted secreted hydrolase